MKFSWSQWAHKTHQKEDFSPRNHQKCDFHWMWFFLFFKRRETASFNLNEPTKPGQIKSKETEVRRWTIDTKEMSNDHTHIIYFIVIITNIIHTYGDDLRNSDTTVSIRNIMADSPPSSHSFWSRPLMANLRKSTTLVKWETTPPLATGSNAVSRVGSWW